MILMPALPPGASPALCLVLSSAPAALLPGLLTGCVLGLLLGVPLLRLLLCTLLFDPLRPSFLLGPLLPSFLGRLPRGPALLAVVMPPAPRVELVPAAVRDAAQLPPLLRDARLGGALRGPLLLALPRARVPVLGPVPALVALVLRAVVRPLLLLALGPGLPPPAPGPPLVLGRGRRRARVLLARLGGLLIELAFPVLNALDRLPEALELGLELVVAEGRRRLTLLELPQQALDLLDPVGLARALEPPPQGLQLLAHLGQLVLL
mmetsp:Transcript_122945/g.358839  ORF Transcript_122945/g.358839 Transcript_122945/m.358839 type:complete len:264 (-) Transcript_122945:404-1195(-)